MTVFVFCPLIAPIVTDGHCVTFGVTSLSFLVSCLLYFFIPADVPMFHQKSLRLKTLELRSLLASVASELTLLSPLGVILLRRRCVCHAFGRAHRQRTTRAS